VALKSDSETWGGKVPQLKHIGIYRISVEPCARFPLVRLHRGKLHHCAGRKAQSSERTRGRPSVFVENDGQLVGLGIGGDLRQHQRCWHPQTLTICKADLRWRDQTSAARPCETLLKRDKGTVPSIEIKKLRSLGRWWLEARLGRSAFEWTPRPRCGLSRERTS
jgi:hypothetical protein